MWCIWIKRQGNTKSCNPIWKLYFSSTVIDTYFMFCKGAPYQCLASFLKCATDYVVGVLSTKLLISRVLLIKRCHPGVWLGLKAALCSPIDIDKPNSHLLCFIVVYFDSRCLIRFRCYRLMVFDLLLKVFVVATKLSDVLLLLCTVTYTYTT